MTTQAPVLPLEKAWQFQADSGIKEPGVTAAYDQIYFATKEGQIYALDATTGQTKWAFKTEKTLQLPLTTADELVFAASKDKNLYAINAKNGQKLWKTKTGHEKHTRPIITENKLLIAGDDDLYAINPSNGTMLWEVKKAVYYQRMPAVAGGLAFTTKNEAIIDLATGKEVDKMRELSDSKAFVSDENLYVMFAAKITVPLHNAEFIFAFDLTTRKEKWQACLNGVIRFWEIKEPYIYAADMWNNKLIILDTSKFTKRWETEAFQEEQQKTSANP